MARTMQIHECDKTSGTSGQKGKMCKISPQSQSHWNRMNKGLLLSMISGFLFPVSHLRKGQMWNISWVVGCAFDWRVKPTELLLNLHSMERKANLPYFKFLSPQPLEQFPKTSPHFLPKLRSNIDTFDQNWGGWTVPVLTLFDEEGNIKERSFLLCVKAQFEILD